MSSSISNCNPKTPTLNVIAKRENFKYILKFELPGNIAHYIDLS